MRSEVDDGGGLVTHSGNHHQADPNVKPQGKIKKRTSKEYMVKISPDRQKERLQLEGAKKTGEKTVVNGLCLKRDDITRRRRLYIPTEHTCHYTRVNPPQSPLPRYVHPPRIHILHTFSKI